MNPMEIISLVIAIMILLKLIVFIAKPDWLSKMASYILKMNNKVFVGLILVLIVVVGYFVLTTLTITQALPAILLGHMLLALLLVMYPKAYNNLTKVVFKDRKNSWLMWLIWAGLSLWVLYVLFL